MSNPLNESTESLGLLANGSCGGWDIAVDESLDGDEWFLELDGPTTYLVFHIQELKVISAAVHFLESRPHQAQNRKGHEMSDREGALPVGRFGPASVSLLWDNEGFPRCFIVIGPKDRSTFRLSLEEEDINNIIDALRQVEEDLS